MDGEISLCFENHPDYAPSDCTEIADNEMTWDDCNYRTDVPIPCITRPEVFWPLVEELTTGHKVEITSSIFTLLKAESTDWGICYSIVFAATYKTREELSIAVGLAFLEVMANGN